MTCECHKKVNYLEKRNDADNPEQQEEENDVPEHDQYLLPETVTAVRLPGVIHIKDFVSEYPDARSSDLPSLFRQMSEIIIGVEDYEYNILTFWILDVFLEGLRTAQLAGMSHRNQKATLHWLAYVYNVLQGTGNKPTRRDLFLNLKMQLFTACEDDEFSSRTSEEPGVRNDFTSELFSNQNLDRSWKIPFPPAWRADSDRYSGLISNDIRLPDLEIPELRTDESIISETERNVQDMQNILEITYRIFARHLTFLLVQTSVHATPKVDIVDLPFKLNVPKQIMKHENTSQLKSDRGGKRSISVKNSDEGNVTRESRKNDYLLPLQAAYGVDTFLRELFALPVQDSSHSEKGKLEKKKK